MKRLLLLVGLAAGCSVPQSPSELRDDSPLLSGPREPYSETRDDIFRNAQVMREASRITSSVGGSPSYRLLAQPHACPGSLFEMRFAGIISRGGNSGPVYDAYCENGQPLVVTFDGTHTLIDAEAMRIYRQGGRKITLVVTIKGAARSLLVGDSWQGFIAAGITCGNQKASGNSFFLQDGNVNDGATTVELISFDPFSADSCTVDWRIKGHLPTYLGMHHSILVED